MPEPATRSLTVDDTRTSPGPASAETRWPMWYACGNTAASAMGRMYPGGGVSLGQSAVFGFVAMETIVRERARSGAPTANSVYPHDGN
jgi:hypothetical protein